MRKKILSSVIISFIINAVLFIINLICANLFNILPLSIAVPGGDCVDHIGFGVRLLEIFSFSLNEGSVSYKISFDFLSIIVSLIGIFLIVLLIKNIIEKRKK